MVKILIGSAALKHHYPDFTREPKDIDYIVEDSFMFPREKGIEYLENPIIVDLFRHEEVLNPDALLTLKLSHMFWDNSWEKHLYDIHFLVLKGARYDQFILRNLIEYWEETLPKIQRSNLNSTREEFFTNAVNKDMYEHDYLHTLLNPEPMYTRLLKDGAEVELEEEKWWRMPDIDKLEVVREEVYCMSYERYNGKLHYVPAFKKQLKSCIIHHFPKYISIFALLNYPTLERPLYNYMELITNKIKNDSTRNY